MEMATSTRPFTRLRAPGDDQRARLVEELRGAPRGLDATELARRLDVHPNTARWHLGILRDAGLVQTRAVASGARGRPRILYSLRPGAIPGEQSEYRLLATILAGLVGERSDSGAETERAGRAWGKYLVKKPLPLTQVDNEEATQEVASLLAEQGFAPEIEGNEIHMHRCPFDAIAEAHPDVVCSVHRGLVAGALEELGSDLEVAGLDVLPRPGVCILRLARRASHDR
jgi:predicted ArsR family transcriptional regulator